MEKLSFNYTLCTSVGERNEEITTMNGFAFTTTGEASGLQILMNEENEDENEDEKRKRKRNEDSNETLEHLSRKKIEKSKGSTAANYRTALNNLRLYNNDQPPTIGQINYHFIDNFCKWLRARGVSQNTIACYMRSLRSLYNYSTRQRKMRNKLPFRNVTTQNQDTRKRVISNSDMKTIKSLDLDNHPKLRLVRDVFLFSFYAMGMPFVDLYHLEYSNIKDNFIIYRRHKTGHMVCVHIEPCMKEIIQRYASTTRSKLFPLAEGCQPDNYATYQLCLCNYNRHLKTIAQMSGVKENVTSYTSRHTWANLAFQKSADINIVSTALGHTNTKTTRIYVNDIINPRLYKINRKIVKEIADSQNS